MRENLNAEEAETRFPGSIDLPAQFFEDGVPDEGLYVDVEGQLRFTTGAWLDGPDARWGGTWWTWDEHIMAGGGWNDNPTTYMIIGFNDDEGRAILTGITEA